MWAWLVIGPVGKAKIAVFTNRLSQFSGLFKGIIRYGLWDGLTIHQQETLAGYSYMNDLAKRAFESTKEIWCPDRAFGECRLGGVDPRSLRRITSLNGMHLTCS